MAKDFYFKTIYHFLNFCSKHGEFSDNEASYLANLVQQAINGDAIYRDVVNRFTYFLRFEKEKSYSRIRDIVSLAKEDLNGDLSIRQLIKKYKVFCDDLDKEVKNFFENQGCVVTEEFINTLEDLDYVHGLYFLFNENKKLTYIGKSKNLRDRVIQSVKERKAHYLKYKETFTMSDANILELYFISKFKPDLNKDSKENDDTTIELKNYSFVKESDFIKIRGEKYES